MAGEGTVSRRWQSPALFLAALLLVAALASNLANLSEPLPQVPRAPDSAARPSGLLPVWVLAVLAWAFAVAMMAFLLWLYVSNRKGLRGLPAPWDLIAVVLAVSILLPLILVWLASGQVPGAVPPEDANETSPGGGGPADLPAQLTRAVPVLGIAFTFIVIAFALATASRSLFQRRPEDARAAPAGERHEASVAVDRAIAALEAGRDPREVILLCYATLMDLLKRRGLSGLDPLTPREVERRALVQLGVPELDLELITSVFEEARYSEHPMGPEARDRALVALQRLRASLGA